MFLGTDIVPPQFFNMFVRILLITAAFATLGKADLPTECGQSTLTASKIVGGGPAQPKQIPWQVFVGRHYTSLWYDWGNGAQRAICRFATSLLNSFSMHNSRESPSDYKWVAGEYDLGASEGTEQQLNAVQFITHPEYNSSTTYNDIGLVRLSSPIIFDDYKKPVCLPAPLDEPTGDCVVSGWGDLLLLGVFFPSKLQKVTMPIITDADCRSQYSNSEIADSMLCAGDTGKDSCQGDSGGPLVVQRADGRWVLQGIVSWGLLCGVKPGVYTQVSYFIPWIENTIASYSIPLSPVHRQYKFIEQVGAKVLH